MDHVVIDERTATNVFDVSHGGPYPMPRRESYTNADDRRLEVLQKPGHNDRHADQGADGGRTQRRHIQHRHGKIAA